jgi:hypothetical protein
MIAVLRKSNEICAASATDLENPSILWDVLDDPIHCRIGFPSNTPILNSPNEPRFCAGGADNGFYRTKREVKFVIWRDADGPARLRKLMSCPISNSAQHARMLAGGWRLSKPISDLLNRYLSARVRATTHWR